MLLTVIWSHTDKTFIRPACLWNSKLGGKISPLTVLKGSD